MRCHSCQCSSHLFLRPSSIGSRTLGWEKALATVATLPSPKEVLFVFGSFGEFVVGKLCPLLKGMVSGNKFLPSTPATVGKPTMMCTW